MPQVPQKETSTDGHGYLDLLLSLRCVPAGVCGDQGAETLASEDRLEKRLGLAGQRQPEGLECG